MYLRGEATQYRTTRVVLASQIALTPFRLYRSAPLLNKGRMFPILLYPTEGIEFIRYLKIPLPFSDILRINIYRAIMKLPYQIFLQKFQKGLDTYEF